ncbi:MAG TPA: hypothetical protein VIX59_17050 [Candidatus Binataceae bacterium]
MKPLTRPAELDAAIAAHAGALLAGNAKTAEKYVDKAALGAHREIVAELERKGPFPKYQDLALARIGFQFMSKIRFEGPRGKVLLLNRWRKAADDQWQLAKLEDISSKRSPWSDIPELAAARVENGDA